MTTGSILFGFALLILIALFLARPLLKPTIALTSVNRNQGQERPLAARKAKVMDELRALDFDHETGKLPPEIYNVQRAQLLAQAADILRQLDAQPALSKNGSPDIVAEIEAAISQMRQKPAETAVNGRFCTQCGQPLSMNDRFCAHCGHAVKQ